MNDFQLIAESVLKYCDIEHPQAARLITLLAAKHHKVKNVPAPTIQELDDMESIEKSLFE